MDVLKIKDSGASSMVYQSIKTVVGIEYEISYDVWTKSIVNMVNNDTPCSSSDSNRPITITWAMYQIPILLTKFSKRINTFVQQLNVSRQV